MVLTPDDARLLFRRWRDDSAPVQVKLFSRWMVFEATGLIADTGLEALGMSGPSWRLTIPLADADYSFSDPREVPIASVREAEASKYEFGIAINLANGDRLTLLELKGVGLD